MNEFEKMSLDIYDRFIKTSKRIIRFQFIFMILCAIMISTYTILAFHDKFLFNIITALIWSVSFTLSFFSIRRQRKIMKKEQNIYYEMLKIVDYQKYIREQRRLKLKKIKWLWL